VLSDPHPSQVKFSTHVCWHDVIWKRPSFGREVLEYRAEELKLFDDFFSGSPLAVHEALAEGFVSVKGCLVRSEPLTDGRNVASFFGGSGNESRLDMGIWVVFIIRGCTGISEGTEPAAKIVRGIVDEWFGDETLEELFGGNIVMSMRREVRVKVVVDKKGFGSLW
jgi:hypothetical protein